MAESAPAAPARALVAPLVQAALAEDLGRAGDVTTDAIVSPGHTVSAALVARKPGRIAGLLCAQIAFETLDPNVACSIEIPDGSDAPAGSRLMHVRGTARALLSAERTALNFVGHLSGIADATQALVSRTAGTRARITDTRKTTPGLRMLEKYAVRAGGGVNHRFGLDDAALIKDNHVVAAGGVRAAIERVRSALGHMVTIECEVDSLDQLREALDAGAHVILLDNMDPQRLREAVGIANGRAILEASGNVTAETVAAIAASGVDVISSGWITHSAPALDVALDFL